MAPPTCAALPIRSPEMWLLLFISIDHVVSVITVSTGVVQIYGAFSAAFMFLNVLHRRHIKLLYF